MCERIKASAPKDSSAMTDTELIEAVAVEVMGWKKMRHARNGAQLMWCNLGVKDGECVDMSCVNDWNPLTDWNHTIQIRDAAVAKFGRCAFVEALGKAFMNHSGFLSYEMLVAHADQKDICLAALRAVRSLSTDA